MFFLFALRLAGCSSCGGLQWWSTEQRNLGIFDQITLQVLLFSCSRQNLKLWPTASGRCCHPTHKFKCMYISSPLNLTLIDAKEHGKEMIITCLVEQLWLQPRLLLRLSVFGWKLQKYLTTDSGWQSIFYSLLIECLAMSQSGVIWGHTTLSDSSSAKSRKLVWYQNFSW